jgi:maltooligosyltrehalose synthase
MPAATHRLQLHKEFTLDDASDIADYLYPLGISHICSSPYLQAASESIHGYDAVDPQSVNDELGGAAAHERFYRKLGEARLGPALDVVRNHMSLGKENRCWWDVLENGPLSRYASYFEIDWRPLEEWLHDKILVPILAVVPRLTAKPGGAWRRAKLALPDGRWKNRLTGAIAEGGNIEIGELLRAFPVALLTQEIRSHA